MEMKACKFMPNMHGQKQIYAQIKGVKNLQGLYQMLQS